MKIVSVISGDLVDSSNYDPQILTTVLEILKKEFSLIKDQFPEEKIHFSLFRGDSFQGVVENSELALPIALQLKAAVNTSTSTQATVKNAMPIADVRISIGIGKATYKANALAESNGEAFQFSGRTLDTMKAEQLTLALTTAYPEINDEFKVHLKFLGATTDRWSIASAEVVYYLLQNYKEQEIAEQLQRSQAAINHRKKAAGWDEIKLLLERYRQVVKKQYS